MGRLIQKYARLTGIDLGSPAFRVFAPVDSISVQDASQLDLWLNRSILLRNVSLALFPSRKRGVLHERSTIITLVSPHSSKPYVFRVDTYLNCILVVGCRENLLDYELTSPGYDG